MRFPKFDLCEHGSRSCSVCVSVWLCSAVCLKFLYFLVSDRGFDCYTLGKYGFCRFYC